MFARLLPDHVQNAVLKGLLVLAQPVLLPGVVVNVAVEVVPPHAIDEKSFTGTIVWLLFKLQTPAVLHEFSKLRWVPATQLLQRRFNLLFLNRVVLFVLAAAWQALPWQRSLD